MKNYVKQAIPSRYLVDKLDISYYIFVPSYLGKIFRENVNFNDNSEGSLKILNLPKPIRVGKTKKGFRLHYLLNLNYNSILRKVIEEDLDVRLMESDFYVSDNVIPSKMRVLLKKNNITISSLRIKAHDIAWKEIEYIKNTIMTALCCSYKLSSPSLGRSVRQAEINYDIHTAPSIYLATNNEIQTNFNSVIQDYKFSHFNDNGELIPPINNLNRPSSAIGQEGNRIYLQGYLSDKTRIKIYAKEESKYGTINRIERVFKDRQQMIPVCDQNSFIDKASFITILDKLGNSTSLLCQQILCVDKKFGKKATRLFIKDCCKRYYGKHYEEAYNSLTKGNQYISTKSNGSASKGVVRKTREIEPKGILVERTATATFRLNMQWVVDAMKDPTIMF